MISVLKAVLFVISNIGYLEFFRRKTNIHIVFLPSLTIAVQTVMLFLAGLLNILGEMTLFLWGIGIVLLIAYAIKDRSLSFISNYKHVSYIYLGITMLLMACYLRGKTIWNYDDFSHWAAAVKYLLREGHYPDFKDDLIFFQTYPLGSSSYIYFFTKLIRETEPVMMLAQVYMITAAIMPLYLPVEKNKITAFLTGTVFTVLFFNYNIETTSLLVDTLLPIVSMCALIYIYFNCGVGFRKSNFYLAGAYLIQIMQIKNSGVFFVFVCVVILLIQVKQGGEIFRRAILSCIPFISLYIWKKHCEYVFLYAYHSKHSMSIESFKTVLRDKTTEEIHQILSSFVKFVFTMREIWTVLAFLLVVGVITVLFFKRESGPWKQLILISLLMLVFYEIGLAGMYIFSMPTGEASELAGGVRYIKTILLAIIYLTAFYLMSLIGKKQTGRGQALAMLLFSMLSFGMIMMVPDGKISLFEENTNSFRVWTEKVKNNYAVQENESYSILINKPDGGMTQFVTRYVFWSTQVQVTVIDDETDFINISGRYVLNYDPKNPLIESWVEENYPSQIGNEVIFRW